MPGRCGMRSSRQDGRRWNRPGSLCGGGYARNLMRAGTIRSRALHPEQAFVCYVDLELFCRDSGVAPQAKRGAFRLIRPTVAWTLSIIPVDLDDGAGHRIDVNVDGLPVRIATFDLPFPVIILNFVEPDHAKGSRRHHGAHDRVSGTKIGESRRRDSEERSDGDSRQKYAHG